MAIDNRNLEVGTRLVANYKKQVYVCTVEKDEEGEGIVFAFEDGKRFKSPSAAGSAVMGGSACNGWRFWSLEGSEPKTGTKAEPAAKTGRTSAKTVTRTAVKSKRNGRKTKHRMIRLFEHQEDVPEGQVRYWCDACMKSFLGLAGAEPEQCPEGHAIVALGQLMKDAQIYLVPIAAGVAVLGLILGTARSD